MAARPVHRQYPFRMIHTRDTDGQVRHHRHSRRPQRALRTHTGEHQKMADPIAPALSTIRSAVRSDGSIGSDALYADGPDAGHPQTSGPGVGQQGEVRAVHRGLQVRAARAHPCPPVDVERYRADARRQRLLERCPVEIVDPPVTGITRGLHESRCAAVEFGDTTNNDRSVRPVEGGVEVDIGFDRAKVRQHVGPCPARYSPAVEIRWQTAAKVATVHGARAAHHRATHDLRLASRVVGQRRRVAPHHRAGSADRQSQTVADLAAHPRVGRARSGFDDRHAAPRIGGKAFGQNRSSAARTDDQHIAVQGRFRSGSGA